MSEESKLYEIITELEHKFDTALATLAFSALALSIQFSPKMGSMWPWMLLISWVLFLLSGLFGGWRMMYRPVALKWNLQRNRHSSDLREVIDPRTQMAVEIGQMMNQHGQYVNESDLELYATHHKEALSHAEAQMNALNKKFPKVMKVQVWLLIAGLFTNGLFASANYLHSIPNNPASEKPQSKVS